MRKLHHTCFVLGIILIVLSLAGCALLFSSEPSWFDQSFLPGADPKGQPVKRLNVDANLLAQKGWKRVMPFWIENDSIYLLDGKIYSGSFAGRDDYFAKYGARVDLKDGRVTELSESDSSVIIDSIKKRIDLVDTQVETVGSRFKEVLMVLGGGTKQEHLFEGTVTDISGRLKIKVSVGIMFKTTGLLKKRSRNAIFLLTNKDNQEFKWETGWWDPKFQQFSQMTSKEWVAEVLNEFIITPDGKYLLHYYDLYRFGEDKPKVILKGCDLCKPLVSPDGKRLTLLRFNLKNQWTFILDSYRFTPEEF